MQAIQASNYQNHQIIVKSMKQLNHIWNECNRCEQHRTSRQKVVTESGIDGIVYEPNARDFECLNTKVKKSIVQCAFTRLNCQKNVL